MSIKKGLAACLAATAVLVPSSVAGAEPPQPAPDPAPNRVLNETVSVSANTPVSRSFTPGSDAVQIYYVCSEAEAELWLHSLGSPSLYFLQCDNQYHWIPNVGVTPGQEALLELIAPEGAGISYSVHDGRL
jgi:hypothetical protein